MLDGKNPNISIEISILFSINTIGFLSNFQFFLDKYGLLSKWIIIYKCLDYYDL